MSLVEVERRDGGVVLLTMNRPDALNALSVALRSEAVDALEALAADDAVGAVVLTGAGRAFSAGVDLKEIAAGRDAPRPARKGGDDLVGALRRCPAPVIAAVNGVCVTGGFEVALACDLMIASSEARFADTHTRLGLVPAWGMSQRLPRLVGPARAKEISLTGNFVTADQAERWGIVNRVVAPAELLPTALALAADMAGGERRAVRAAKAMIDQGFELALGEGLELERQLAREYGKGMRRGEVAERTQGAQERARQQSR
ncbi:MAG: enoyl-CoA hydratase [Acidimicrobiales bacterium]